MDIAALGLAVDSSQVEKGTASLTKMSGAAGRAQAAASGLAGASMKTASAATSVSSGAANAAAALTRESAAANAASAALNRHTVAANQNASAMRGGAHSVGNLAAQFQDVGVSAAMGMGAMQIALQQGTQLSAELGPMGAAGAVRSLGAAFLSIISPMSLAVIAAVGLVAAGLQMVDWSATAAMAMTGLATALEVIGPYAVMAAAGLALLYAPQIIGGLVGVIALLGRVSVAAVTAALTIAAANPGAAIILGLTAAVAAANIFRDELTQIFGVDIVGAAKDGVNAIIGAFVGGYNYVVTTWDDLPLVFSGLGKKAYNALLDELSGKTLLTIPGTDIEWKTPSLSGLKSEVTKEEEAAMNGLSATFGNAMGQDYLGDIGGAISRGASGAADKLRELAAGMSGAGSAAAAAGAAAKDAGAAIGSAANDNIDPWEGLRGAVNQASGAMEKAREFAQGIASDFTQGLRSGKSFWESFKQAGLNAIGKIADALVESGINSIFSGGIGGGGSGIFGSIVSGLGSLLGFASGGYTGAGPANQVAGAVHKGEYVFSKPATERIGVQNLEAMHRSGRAPSNQNQAPKMVRIEQHFHISGAVSSDDVQRMVRAGASESVQVVKDSLPGWQTDIQLFGRPA